MTLRNNEERRRHLRLQRAYCQAAGFLRVEARQCISPDEAQAHRDAAKVIDGLARDEKKAAIAAGKGEAHGQAADS